MASVYFLLWWRLVVRIPRIPTWSANSYYRRPTWNPKHTSELHYTRSEVPNSRRQAHHKTRSSLGEWKRSRNSRWCSNIRAKRHSIPPRCLESPFVQAWDLWCPEEDFIFVSHLLWFPNAEKYLDEQCQDAVFLGFGQSLIQSSSCGNVEASTHFGIKRVFGSTDWIRFGKGMDVVMIDSYLKVVVVRSEIKWHLWMNTQTLKTWCQR